jgi:hypothetical protein
MNKIRSLRQFIPLKLFVAIMVISILAVVSFAASVTISTSTSEAVQGVIYNVVGGFTAANNGFAVTYSAASATSLPAAWSNGGTVTTATTFGYWQYSLTVTITALATAGAPYTVTVQWNTGSGYTTLGSALTFNAPATINAGQTMTFVFNTGVTTFNAPAGLLITIA